MKHADWVDLAIHDLKSPLTFMGLTLQNLRENVASLSPEKLAHQLEMLESATDKMQYLVQNYLDQASQTKRLENQHPEPTDLKSLVNKVLSFHTPQANTKSLRLDNELPAHPLRIMANWQATERILDNLISNAIKYSRPGTDIHVRGESCACHYDCVRLEIEDQGPGFSAEEQSVLYQPFVRFQPRPTADASNSHGLGLYIAKQLTEAIHGKLQCLSQPGQGTRFVLDLPAAH